MQKVIFFVACIFISFGAIAQQGVTFNGSQNNSTVTSGQLLGGGALSVAGCQVTKYIFSIAVGTKYWGPVNVNGAQLTDEIKNKIREFKGPNVNVYFDDMHVVCGGKEQAAGPFHLKYDQ